MRKTREYGSAGPSGETTNRLCVFGSPQQFKDEASELPARYEIKEVIGRGAYGSVYTCRDTVSDTFVAIKKIHHVFKKEFDFQKRIYREIKILKHIRNKHPNVSCYTCFLMS